MVALKLIAVAALIVAATASGDDHDDHDDHDEHGHENHAWEWAGTFSLVKDSPYTWIMSKKDGAYADADMKLAIVKTTTNDKAGLEAAEERAEALFDGNDTEVTSNAALEVDTLYHLELDQDEFMTTFRIQVNDTSAYAIFTQHFPTEFEDKYHFLKDAAGVDIEPGFGGGHEEAASGNMAPVGTAFLASFLSAMAAFTGVVMLVPTVSQMITQSKAAAFASGALLAAALFLMWPESLHLIPVNMENKDEANVSAVFGACILAGFVTTILVQWATTLITGSAGHGHGGGEVVAAKAVEDVLEGGSQPEGETASSADTTPKAVDWSLVAGVALGDFFHNFVDGVIIGASFKQCNTSQAWGVAASTIAHEVSQELGDFLLLTKQGGLTVPKALCINFLSALSCILGTLIVYATDPNDSVVGCLLAYGGGCYMYIATVPVFKQVVDQVTAKAMITHFFIFFFGALCIGLVLLDHEHCSAPGTDPHAGHGH
jgi:zinc transporter ZupT